MTVRAKPVVRRHGYEGRDRRNLLVNLGFVLVVVVAVLLLVIAGAAVWYGDHLAPAAHVNGQAITKDEFKDRLRLDAFRLNLTQQRLDDRNRAGTITSADYTAAQYLIQQQTSSIDAIALEHLIDGRIQADLATQEGIAVSDAEIDAKLTEDATQSEERRAWAIEVAPQKDANAAEPTDAQKAAAKQTADTALADLKAGKKWEDVSNAVSTRSDKATGGDLGYINNQISLDPAFVRAVFAAQKDGLTDVVAGADGTYRIGRVTDILAATTDANYQQLALDKGISSAQLRGAARQDVISDKLRDRVVAGVSGVGPQRHVSEIFIGAAEGDTDAAAVRVRHILYQPKQNGTANPSLPPTDPAWTDAENKAKAAVAKLRADPSLFPQLAKDESDDTGSGAQGGELGYVNSETQFVPEFKDAVLKPGLQPGQILDPVKSQYGWHVIQIQNMGPTSTWAATLKQQADSGADFAKLAKANSDDTDSALKGGDLGWVGKGLLASSLETSIFSTPVGQVSSPLVIASDDAVAQAGGAKAGTYIFKVVEEANRAPDPDELQKLKATAFTTWYAQKKAAVAIVRDINGPADTQS